MKYSIIVLLPILISCSDQGAIPSLPQPTDAELLTLARSSGPWVFYRNSADTLLKAIGSAHDEPRLRTRYNAKAATQLDAAGKVRINPNFPDSSLIVKELFTGTTITTYAIILKLRSAVNAGNGWVWSETDAAGIVKISASSKGAGCIACHSMGLDNTRMNDTHP